MKNQQELDKYIDKIIQDAEKETTRIYARRYREIRNEIATMYEKYEQDGKLTLAQMTKYNRLDKSLDFIIGELISAQDSAYKLAQQTMEQTLLENYYRTAYLTEFEAQRKLGFGMLSRETIEAAVENPIDRLKLPAVKSRNRKQIVDRIRNDIAQGLARGSSYREMSRIVRDAVDFDAHKSRTVVATEAHRTQTEGRYRSMKQAEKYIDVQKRWDATLDSDTRRGHRQLDGETIGTDEEFRSPAGGRGKAPGHMYNAADDINCRCSLVTVVEGYEPTVRRERLEDGSTNTIPYLTYEEWEKNRIGEKVLT